MYFMESLVLTRLYSADYIAVNTWNMSGMFIVL